MRFKTLTSKQIDAIEAEVKMMLHASRDCYRNQGKNSREIPFWVNDGYYGEAAGIFRTLQILGYGVFGAINVPHERTNLSWWFSKLQDEVLKEENFGKSGECDYCLQRYGKDDASRKRENLVGVNDV